MRQAHIYYQVSGFSIRLLPMEHSKTIQAMPYVNSKTIELFGRLHADLFSSDKMLINGVDMNIKLARASEGFYLQAPFDDNKLRIKILDATLFITQVELKPPLLALANVLGMKRKAH